MNKTRERAVVLGGSMAGTLAARVLAESFSDVVVIDRDDLVGVRESRRGTPHSHHAHGLHSRGLMIVEELFPGLTEEVLATGALASDIGRIRWHFNGRPITPTDVGLVMLAPSRPVLEYHVRGRVAALPNVRYLERHDILRPLSTPGRDRVTGVLVRRQWDGAEIEFEADLVVDATGRGSRTPAWLAELGYERPAEDRIKIGLTYTTRHYRVDPKWFEGAQSIVFIASPAHPRGAFFGQLGDGVCVLSLTGILGDHPPTDPDGFLEFARTLPKSVIYDAIRESEPLENATSFGFPTSVRRRYEQLTRFPDGLVVLGDAVASFNPLYGQGMTVTAVEAMALRDMLREKGTGDIEPKKFLKVVADAVKTPWEMNAGGDLAFPDVPGERTARTRFANAYMARVQYATSRDPKVTRAFMRVAGMVARPETLFKPGLAARVLRLAPRIPEPGPSWLDNENTPNTPDTDLPKAA
ncbi:NAD(P)/FAD-dependent oxidoreductase [Actinophytocola sp. NPDC049390]|uniref:NAD(P)/FAD-dependent oxidoreductase n=1 Tax=Actinophytocola sp. NPDC049390 TaxID=3363894 RepID=UPI0037973BFB